MNTKEEICVGLEESFTALIGIIESQDEEKFEKAPESKWSSGQQLDHLIKSVRPLTIALHLPDFVFKLIFGKMNREGRSYEALMKKFYEKLSGGHTATSPFIPPQVKFADKQKKLIAFQKHLKRLLKHLDKYSETRLDSILLPHPLFGKVSLREMLFFTIFHTHHHTKIIKELTNY
ncbi:MAG: DinB family protein [Flavobacteriales bacterium]|nr:DinB family protein [Flavobacteriales bacterium]